jgi:hypothetical protein
MDVKIDKNQDVTLDLVNRLNKASVDAMHGRANET